MTTGSFMAFAGRLLHCWVRERIFPENAGAPGALAIDPARPVCYVLHENWLSDRLVLREVARRIGLPVVDRPLVIAGRRLASAEFQLVQGWHLFGAARARYRMPSRLIHLVEALRVDRKADVQLVPVTVLWGRAPKQQDSILRALFAESWQRRHPLGHWLSVLLHGRQAHVHFGQPLSLRAHLLDVPNSALAAKKCVRILRTHFRRQRETAIGPDVSHRHTQVTALLASREVREAIAAEAQRERISRVMAHERARRHVLAIASDYAYGVVRAGELFLTWLWTRLFDGVEVRNFDVLSRIAAGQSIVYVPCHRSHLDYLLLSYVVFRGGLTPPHVAAGDNLDMPLLGALLRRGGAFFLRRSFKGDPLYASVFAEYLHRMLARGFPIEFFIEGGRSRHGRLLSPKAGLLGMTVRSFIRHHARPLVFVPVYIGYEKLPEGASFVRELAGEPKCRESLWGALSAVRILRRHFGQVYVNFGTPLPLAEWLDERYPAWGDVAPDQPGEADWLRAAVGDIADELARRINAAALVNPVNLIALALLSAPESSADAIALARQIEHLQGLMAADQCAAPADGAACIGFALKLEAVHRVEQAAGTAIVADASEAALLAYFRNNVLHLFALPALVASLVLQHGTLAEARLRDMAAGLLGVMRDKLFLQLQEDDLSRALEETLGRLEARGLIVRREGRVQVPGDASSRAALGWLGDILRPLLAAAV